MPGLTSQGKIVIIGGGNVGATIAYTIMLHSLTSEIVIIDINQEKAKGEALDINHGIAYFKQITVRYGDYSECMNADIIIVTAGVGRKPGQNRMDLAKINTGIAKEIAHNIMRYANNPIIVVVSNPVDILTYVIQKETCLPTGQVIGTGTSLDTARFRYLLGRHCGVDVRNVHAYIIGEHGDSEVPIWSGANIAGKPFSECCIGCQDSCQQQTKEDIFKETKDAGAEIIALKGATTYGIAMATTRIVGAIIGGENTVLPVSSVLNGQYGISDIAVSVPCIIGSRGIERVMSINIDEDETQQLQDSVQKVRDMLEEAYL